ncbi:DEAD/DEAH box helicase [Haloferax marisrubri]|uniref:AAA family ATPase n=1 Tax=Haloferax marisrubri TaxID=1544719 RepID=A0A2P4NPS1_9EURY|nr:AAA domain-containing protein [Haloferax marisrubri]POG55068.1 AAA family ATPase [Haloferax marisrubri]
MKELFDSWKYSRADLLRVNTRSKTYDRVPVTEAASNAVDELSIKNPSGKGYIVPLFSLYEPTPRDKYVIYKPDTGQIGWFDTGFSGGVERFAAAEKLETTEIGQRLRFWHPSHQSEVEIEFDESELPASTVHPVDSLNKQGRKAFFEELTGFVRSEMDAARESNWEQYEEIELDQAIRRNRVSGPFLPLGKGKDRNGNEVYRFQLAQDEGEDDGEPVDIRDGEGIFPKNLCIADIDGVGGEFPIEVEVMSVDDPIVSLRPRWGSVGNRQTVDKYLCSDTVELWLHDLLNPIPYERQLDAINAVKRNGKKSGLLTGNRPISFSVNKYATIDSPIELNEYQRLALVWADGAEDFVCIHGPPGTGKTRTLTAYVRHAVERGQKVLVTAHSNQAVDNLLVGDSTVHKPDEDTLHEMAQDPVVDLSIARVGSNSKNDVVNAHYTDVSPSSSNVVAATTSGASEFDSNSFDVAVIDEATQASRPATSIVLNCAKKLVLAGDHKQLPPYCADETMQDEEMHISLFEYLLERYGEKTAVLLRKQYRMNEEIAEFPNVAFYGGNLKTADINRDWRVDNLKPLMGIDIEGKEQQESYGKSYYNREEAEAVAKQVKLLVQSDLSIDDIGVITAYSGQISQIKQQVNSLSIPNSRRLTVDTVDSFQGGEREAIIVSFVRSNPDGHAGFLEFPDVGPRRLNVALTRARKRLVLIGNWETLSTIAPHRTEDDSCAPRYAKLAAHIRSRERMLSQKKQP